MNTNWLCVSVVCFHFVAVLDVLFASCLYLLWFFVIFATIMNNFKTKNNVQRE